MIITTDKVMRPRDEHDFYPTPQALADAALDLLPETFKPIYILDPGAGTGVWGKAAVRKWDRESDGIELRPARCPNRDNERLYYCQWLDRTDYLTWQPRYFYDLVLGNPPYRHAEAFVRKAIALTRPGGYVLFLLRLAFLEGQARGAGLWRDLPPAHVAVCSRRPSFTGNGKTDATAYAVFIWQVDRPAETRLSFLDYPSVTEKAA